MKEKLLFVVASGTITVISINFNIIVKCYYENRFLGISKKARDSSKMTLKKYTIGITMVENPCTVVVSKGPTYERRETPLPQCF